ncbi:hypothetical protein F2P47_13940 [Parvibaculum sedimenti]|uniref:Flagellar protein FlgN n=1 Tax=Parvibaculum sedimenti TaxID=2608632 RepID=A0A6N6VEU5_9HYPH|nr:hypothetical protein [Parvibaculum sedimenti]KAB7739105.1 hypothetical protein F2P47_13940 [Parvibaculum sedimenti]
MSEPHRIAAGDLSPAALVDRMLAVADQLGDIIIRETGHLQACEPLRIGELQEQKIRLANEYAMDVRAVTLRKDLIDRAPAEKVATLKAAMTKLDSLLRANEVALGAAKSVSERLLKAVANAVSEKKAPVLGYGRNAAIARPSGSSPAAIAHDARV